jgi:hypothetical protein
MLGEGSCGEAVNLWGTCELHPISCGGLRKNRALRLNIVEPQACRE